VSLNYSKVGKEYAIRDASGKIYRRSLEEMCDFFIKKNVLSSDLVLNKEKFIAGAIINKMGKLAYPNYSNQVSMSHGN
jgi:hypothetical protein